MNAKTTRRLKKAGITVGSVVAVLVIVGLILPAKYEVSRSVVIHASKAQVHALISDLTEWSKWEPWTEGDPSIKVTLGDITAGVGATQSWTDAHGGGELRITLDSAEEGVGFEMLFAKKYKAQGMITYSGPDDAVRVTWSMVGEAGGPPVVRGYMARLMPGMIGPMFERGLEKLKTAAEAE